MPHATTPKCAHCWPRIDDGPTRRAIATERALLAARGGGCHQHFGATQLHVPGLGDLLRWREAGAGDAAQLQLAAGIAAAASRRRARCVGRQRTATAAPPRPLPDAAGRCAQALASARAVFIAHPRALPAYAGDLDAAAVNRCAHLWVPGTATWFELARRGVWIEGCAEGLGFETLAQHAGRAAAAVAGADRLAGPDARRRAAAGWSSGQVLATYASEGGGAGAAGRRVACVLAQRARSSHTGGQDWPRTCIMPVLPAGPPRGCARRACER